MLLGVAFILCVDLKMELTLLRNVLRAALEWSIYDLFVPAHLLERRALGLSVTDGICKPTYTILAIVFEIKLCRVLRVA